MPKPVHPLRGYLYIASATFLWGVSAALGRAAFTGRLLQGRALPPIEPLILSQCRSTFSLLVLLPVLLLLRGPATLCLPGKDIGRLFLLGILGVPHRTTSTTSPFSEPTLLQRSSFNTPRRFGSCLRIRQRTAPADATAVAAVALALTGIAFVIGIFSSGGFRLDAVGVTAALLAALSFAFYNVAGHDLLARYDRWIVLLYTLLSASLFWLILNPPWKIAAAHHSIEQWVFLFGFSLLSVLGPFAFYFAGLQHLEPTRAIVVSCLEPVFSIVIAALTLGEILGPLQTLGIVLVLTAIVVVQLPDRKLHEEAAPIEPLE